MLMHLQMHENVQYCAFTDATKGDAGAAGGVWEGMRMEHDTMQDEKGIAHRMRVRNERMGRGNGNERTKRCIGEGLWGIGNATTELLGDS